LFVTLVTYMTKVQNVKDSRKFNLYRICTYVLMSLGPGELSQCSDWLQAGQSGDRIPVGTRFIAHVQTGPGAHPAFCTVGTRSFLGVKWRRCGADHPPLLAPRSRKSRAIPQPPPLSLRVSCGVLLLFLLMSLQELNKLTAVIRFTADDAWLEIYGTGKVTSMNSAQNSVSM
jgi:hypothetical protein